MDAMQMMKRVSKGAGNAMAAANAAVDQVKAVINAEPADPLDAFADTEKLFVKQKVETLEAVANAVAGAVGMDSLAGLGETANKYDVYTNDGGKRFKVVEASEACSFEGMVPTGRACCRPNHALKLHVYRPGMFGSKEVMLIDRPFKCAGCCCTCANACAQQADVYAATTESKAELSEERRIATIRQPLLGGGLAPALDVMDREGKRLATITGPTCCIGGMCFDNTFRVTAPDGTEIGTVVKEAPNDFGEAVKEGLTDADNFTLSMPKAADVKTKAAMMASLLLLDYMFFESEGDFKCDPFNCACTYKCCDLYCCGCLCPCTCTCGGGPDEPHTD